jgi:hypothetical protein
MQGFAQSLVVLPLPLQVVLAVGVLFVVRLALGKFLPDAALSEISAAITTALLTIIGIVLGLIPLELEAVATAILNLLAILLGGVVVVNGYVKARRNGFLK